ncbi:hypothetical protein M9458_051741, partial [Cirrhinus mrigala]
PFEEGFKTKRIVRWLLRAGLASTAIPFTIRVLILANKFGRMQLIGHKPNI